MDKFICKICNKKYDVYDLLRRHCVQIHKQKSENIFIEYQCNGIRQTCLCGCGENTRYNGHGFSDYSKGHVARVKNNFNTEKSMGNSIKTRRERFATGEISTWNKGLTIEDERVKANIDKVMANPERGNNISKTLTGMPKSDEHIQKMTEHWKTYWSDPVHREEQRLRRVEYLQNDFYSNQSKLEITFSGVLDILKINYKFQYSVAGYNYDYYLPDEHVLIEVDGDFHHCNPIKWPEPIHPIQIHTVEHDIVKNKIALDNGYKLIRIWEDEINTDLPGVMKRLLNEIV